MFTYWSCDQFHELGPNKVDDAQRHTANLSTQLDKPQPDTHFDALNEHYFGGALLKRHPSWKETLSEHQNEIATQPSMTGHSLIEINSLVA